MKMQLAVNIGWGSSSFFDIQLSALMCTHEHGEWGSKCLNTKWEWLASFTKSFWGKICLIISLSISWEEWINVTAGDFFTPAAAADLITSHEYSFLLPHPVYANRVNVNRLPSCGHSGEWKCDPVERFLFRSRTRSDWVNESISRRSASITMNNQWCLSAIWVSDRKQASLRWVHLHSWRYKCSRER